MLFQTLDVSKHADAHSRKRAMSLTKLSEYMLGRRRRRRRICLLELHRQPLAENNERRFRTSAAAAEADIECNCAKRNNGHPSVVQRDLWWGLALVLYVLGCLVFILSLFSLAFNQLKILYLWAYIFQQQFTVSESLPSERVFTQRKVLLQFFFLSLKGRGFFSSSFFSFLSLLFYSTVSYFFSISSKFFTLRLLTLFTGRISVRWLLIDSSGSRLLP